MKGNYYKKSLTVLDKLKHTYPDITLGKHLFTCFNEYNLENISDKDLYNNLFDYLSELESDVPHNDDVEQIIRVGMNLNNILEDEE